jgi:hypothetical protein
MKIYPKTLIDLEWEVMDLLHQFHKECLTEPFKGEPLERQNRKRIYAKKIMGIFINSH